MAYMCLWILIHTKAQVGDDFMYVVKYLNKVKKEFESLYGDEGQVAKFQTLREAKQLAAFTSLRLLTKVEVSDEETGQVITTLDHYK